ncbi:hypothetical protein [Amycolatopsis palatopharyngis]|uniref:hypothetical protein n=1 Tax=Amycolatopsis palatopharyngis TaxID=187982 RepID=UPI003CCC88BE
MEDELEEPEDADVDDVEDVEEVEDEEESEDELLEDSDFAEPFESPLLLSPAGFASDLLDLAESERASLR